MKQFTGGRLIKFFCLVTLLTFAQLVKAQSLNTGLAGHPLVQAFPNSTLVSSTFSPESIHQVALGILQRNSGVAEPEEVRRVTGDLTKVLYEISPEFSGADVYDFFRTQLVEKSFDELFTCKGRSCGSSNDWANDIFKNRILYGPAQNQYYMAYQKFSDDNLSPYVSVYIITRGNRRLYAYLEVVEPKSGSLNASEVLVSTMEETLLSNGYSSLSDIEFANDQLVDDESLQPLIAVLKKLPEIELYIVSHLAASGSLEEAQRRSQNQADSILQALIDAGISPSRLSSHGVGPLAPNCASTQCKNRVDVVLR